MSSSDSEEVNSLESSSSSASAASSSSTDSSPLQEVPDQPSTSSAQTLSAVPTKEPVKDADSKKKDLPRKAADDSTGPARPKISKTTSMMPSVGKKAIKADSPPAASGPKEKVSGKISKLKDLGEDEGPDDLSFPYIGDPSKAPEPRKKKHRVRVVGDASRVPSFKIEIHLPDGSRHALQVLQNFTGKELLHTFAEKISLWQVQFFTLAIRDDSLVHYLDWQKEIGEQGIKEGTILDLVVKYGKNPFKWADPVAARCMATGMNALIAAGKISVPSKVAVRLAALQVLIRFGTAVAKTKTSFLTKELLAQVLPPFVMESTPVDYLQQRILFYYRKYSEMKYENMKFAASVMYIELGRESVIGWGAVMTEAQMGDDQVTFGIVEDGFIFKVVDEKSKSKPEAVVPFNDSNFEHERGASTITITINKKAIKIQCGSKREADQIQDLMESYMFIMGKQGVEGYESAVKLTVAEDTPYYIHLTLPVNRDGQEANYKSEGGKKASMLALFRDSYVKNCEAANAKVLNRLMLQIETKLEQGETHDALDLRRCGLTEKSLALVVKSVEDCFALTREAKKDKKYAEDFKPTKILVSANSSFSTMDSICRLMEICTITTIDAADCALGASAASLLATTIRQKPTLKELILDRNHEIGDAGVRSLTAALRDQEQFITLSLAQCGITKDAASDLTQFFRTSKSIQNICLADNKIGDLPMMNILEAAEKAKGTLLSLDFTNTAMGSASAKALKVFLEGEDKIGVIKIGYNNFPETVGRVIASIIPEGDVLRELDISHIGIGSKATRPIIEALASNKTIKRLNLSGNPIDKSVAGSLATLISENKYIEFLSFRNCGLEKAILKPLALALADNNTIKELDMSGNRMDSREVLEAWEAALSSNKSLKILYFSGCKMDSAGCAAIGAALSENKTLERLHLDGNKITGGLGEIAEGLLQNQTLRILTMQDAHVRADHLQIFLDRIRDHSGLEVLDVTLNKFKDAMFMRKLAAEHAYLDLKY